MLLETNELALLASYDRGYIAMAQVGKDQNYIGADVILRWYERNMKIFVNLTRLITSPDERVLVVIRSGHLSLLTHFVEAAGRFTLESARTYLA